MLNNESHTCEIKEYAYLTNSSVVVVYYRTLTLYRYCFILLFYV